MSKNRLHYGIFSVVLLMSVLLIVFLSSCGSETPSKPEPALEKAESAEAPAPAEPPPAEQAVVEEKAPAETAPEKAESAQAPAPAEPPSAGQAAVEEKAPAEPQGEVTPPPPEQDGGAEMQGGGPVVFSDTKSMPPVTFKHEVHASKGLKCADCHAQVFAMQKGATSKADLTMAAMREGKTCGICHNGDKVFSVAGNCTRCHAK